MNFPSALRAQFVLDTNLGINIVESILDKGQDTLYIRLNRNEFDQDEKRSLRDVLFKLDFLEFHAMISWEYSGTLTGDNRKKAIETFMTSLGEIVAGRPSVMSFEGLFLDDSFDHIEFVSGDLCKWNLPQSAMQKLTDKLESYEHFNAEFRSRIEQYAGDGYHYLRTLQVDVRSLKFLDLLLKHDDLQRCPDSSLPKKFHSFVFEAVTIMNIDSSHPLFADQLKDLTEFQQKFQKVPIFLHVKSSADTAQLEHISKFFILS